MHKIYKLCRRLTVCPTSSSPFFLPSFSPRLHLVAIKLSFAATTDTAAPRAWPCHCKTSHLIVYKKWCIGTSVHAWQENYFILERQRAKLKPNRRTKRTRRRTNRKRKKKKNFSNSFSFHFFGRIVLKFLVQWKYIYICESWLKHSRLASTHQMLVPIMPAQLTVCETLNCRTCSSAPHWMENGCYALCEE